ncbi:MAG: hypothetical protein ABIO43_03455 [Sphingomicrobium sp.]
MTRTLLTLTFLASAALAGCNKEDHTLVEGGDKDTNVTNAADIVLPPSIAASKAYRCKDNSLVYIDWMSDGGARVKKGKDDVGEPIPAGAPTLSGDAQATSITYNGKSCKA